MIVDDDSDVDTSVQVTTVPLCSSLITEINNVDDTGLFGAEVLEKIYVVELSTS